MTNPKEALEWYERKRVEARAMADRNCEQCKHNKADGCSRWDCEYEPVNMSEVSRVSKIVTDGIRRANETLKGSTLQNIINAYEKGFQAQVVDLTESRPTGEWIKTEHCLNDIGYRRWIEIECPFCGERPTYEFLENMKYCPNCGAKMRGGEDE